MSVPATWQMLIFLKGKPGVRSTELRNYAMKGLGRHRAVHTTYFELLSVMLRTSLIGQRGQRGGTIYYLTAYGDGLLKAYNAHPPSDPPTTDDNDDEQGDDA